MNNQKENSRLDEGNLSDKNTDVTRSQNRQAATDANEGRNALNHSVDGKNGHHGGDETASHREGQYDKDHSKLGGTGSGK
jgi:hypothetical protein